jgi:hypothetical protein
MSRVSRRDALSIVFALVVYEKKRYLFKFSPLNFSTARPALHVRKAWPKSCDGDSFYVSQNCDHLVPGSGDLESDSINGSLARPTVLDLPRLGE